LLIAYEYTRLDFISISFFIIIIHPPLVNKNVADIIHSYIVGFAGAGRLEDFWDLGVGAGGICYP
jgi:hypothetical protein